ncbi:MAG: hypothetical protein A2W33_03015 [Chloroflexi bacterium RBG_16_52_11]|nr:MAG: hypothetical protein A2W33_03015 [Chloroflexi bacterium RBG_16_52_11]
MEYKRLFNGEKISVLGLGTWRMGGSLYPDYSQDDQVIGTIQAAIELGYTHIDTAEMYAAGHTEELVGKAILNFPRQSLFITTKIWHTNLSYEDIHPALQGSLRRLGTDYIDMCLVHWPNKNISFDETFRALNEMVAAGEVHHLGVSNFNLEMLQRAQELCATPIVTNQVPYNLYNHTYIKNGVLKYCQQNDILVTAYSPFDRGAVLINDEVQRIAAQYGKTPAQIALHWLIQQPNVVTIPMSSSPEHLKSNLGALDVALSPAESDVLDHLELPEEALWPE